MSVTKIPDWFWAFAEWRLGRGAYKGHGSDPKFRPKIVPEKIPYWAWVKLALMTGGKVPDPPPKPDEDEQALELARAMLTYCRGFTGHYLYGGGHGVKAAALNRGMNLDCSSSTSLMLHHFGMLDSEYVQVSGWFESWRRSGRGKHITVHASGEHVWTEFNLPEGYYRMDTSPHGDGPPGPRVRTRRRFDSTFVHRHSGL
jgi:hypothetical protein